MTKNDLPSIRYWRGADLNKAAQYWKEGYTIKEISVLIGRTPASIANQIRINREMFPRRMTKYPTAMRSGPRKIIHFPTTQYIHAELKRVAKERGTSVTAVVRDAIRRELQITNDGVPKSWQTRAEFFDKDVIGA